jgi:microcystin-dependent protein
VSQWNGFYIGAIERTKVVNGNGVPVLDIRVIEAQTGRVFYADGAFSGPENAAHRTAFPNMLRSGGARMNKHTFSLDSAEANFVGARVLEADWDPERLQHRWEAQLIMQLVGNPPLGSVIGIPGNVDRYIQDGTWKLCNGEELRVADYLALYALIQRCNGGRTDAAGVEWFRLPDLRGQFLRGLDTSGLNLDPDVGARTPVAGAAGGASPGTKQDSAFGRHDHALTQAPHHHGSNYYAWDGGAHRGPQNPTLGSGSGGCLNHVSTYDATINITVNANGAAETRPKNVAVNWIIRVKVLKKRMEFALH